MWREPSQAHTSSKRIKSDQPSDFFKHLPVTVFDHWSWNRDWISSRVYPSFQRKTMQQLIFNCCARLLVFGYYSQSPQWWARLAASKLCAGAGTETQSEQGRLPTPDECHLHSWLDLKGSAPELLSPNSKAFSSQSTNTRLERLRDRCADRS